MVYTTKVFTSGNSQAVRLPKEYQFEEREVQIQRVGNAVIIYPAADPWAAFRSSLEQFSEDFLNGGREQPGAPDRDIGDVFD